MSADTRDVLTPDLITARRLADLMWKYLDQHPCEHLVCCWADHNLRTALVDLANSDVATAEGETDE